MAGRKINDLPSKATLEPTDELVVIDNTGNEGARVLASELQNAIDDTTLSADLISADVNNELVQGTDSLLYTASPVQTVFGRSGTVVAQSGDYDASEVTNAFDTTSNTTDDVTEGSTNLYNRLPTGGTAGQVLEKVDGTDYNTQWATPSGSSGALEYVGEVTPSGSTVTFSFTGADPDETFLLRLDRLSCGTGGNIFIRFNGTTSSSYRMQYIKNIGTTVSGSSQLTTSIQIANGFSASSLMGNIEVSGLNNGSAFPQVTATVGDSGASYDGIQFSTGIATFNSATSMTITFPATITSGSVHVWKMKVA